MTDNNRPSRFEGGPTPARPAAPGRPAAPAPTPRRKPIGPASGRLPRGFGMLAAVCAAILALGLLLQGAMPGGFALKTAAGTAVAGVEPVEQVTEIHGDGPIRLNEIMTANGGVLVDDGGETPDWVEVANVGSRPVNLEGYALTKRAGSGNRLVFPDWILQPGECAVVCADNVLRATPGQELHAPFRLSSTGDTLMLFNASDMSVAVDTVNIPALSENEAYIRADRGTWKTGYEATPGMANTEENYRAMNSVVASSPVQMVQIVASNTRHRPDESGVFHDYIVLRNASGEAVDLTGWYLSDDPHLPRLWKFPAGVTIPGGGTLTVYCSGLNRATDPERPHTGFRLSSEGETVTLSNASGQPVDRVSFDLLRTDTAYLRGEDGNWSVGEATD